MDTWLSNLVAFLLGTATGAAGTYFADKYTDRRKESEEKSKQRRRFRELRESMPELFEEMNADLSKDPLVREFAVIPNRRVIFNHSIPRFTYYEDEHPDLQSKILLIADASFVRDVSVGDTPLYRMNESLVRLLLHK